jgi:hypothetical protein
MPIQLRCVDRERKGQVWSLDLGPQQVIVRDSIGTAVGSFTPEEAISNFQMPSFSENIKYFGILLGGTVHRFDVPKEGLREIKALVNRSIAAAGPEAVQSVKRRAIRDTLIGAVCAAGGIALTIGSYMSAANKPEGGSYTITWGLVLFGLVMIGKGVYGFWQYNQVQRLAGP